MGTDNYFKRFDHSPVRRAKVPLFGDLDQFDMVDERTDSGYIEYPAEVFVQNAIDDPDVLQEQSAIYVWNFLKGAWLRDAKEEVDIEPLLTQTSIVQNGKIELENIPSSLELYSLYIYEEVPKPDGSGTVRVEHTPSNYSVELIDEIAYVVLNDNSLDGMKVIYKTKPFASLLDGVMNITVVDDFPVENSDYAVKSGGVYTAIQEAMSNISSNSYTKEEVDQMLEEQTKFKHYANISVAPDPTLEDFLKGREIYIIDENKFLRVVPTQYPIEANNLIWVQQ